MRDLKIKELRLGFIDTAKTSVSKDGLIYTIEKDGIIFELIQLMSNNGKDTDHFISGIYVTIDEFNEQLLNSFDPTFNVITKKYGLAVKKFKSGKTLA